MNGLSKAGLITKILFCLFSFSLFSGLVHGQRYPEIITDKPYYVSGESMRYAVFLNTADYFEKSDQIFYVELWSEKGALIGRHIFLNKDGLLHGKFSLSPDIPTSACVLRLYSSEMLRHPYQVPTETLLIWNQQESFNPEHPVLKNASNTLMAKESNHTISTIPIQTDKDNYSTRSKIEVRLDLPEKISGDPSFKMIVLARFDHYFPSDISFRDQISNSGGGGENQGSLPDHVFLSRDRLLLRGHYQWREEKKDNIFKLITLSILGDDPVFEYEYTNNNGDFIFDLSNVKGDREKVYLSTINGHSDAISIRKPLFPPLTDGNNLLYDVNWNVPIQNYLKNAAMRNQIKENYNIDDKVSATEELRIIDTTRVYQEADQTFILSEYVDFRDMQELIREILLYVKIQDRGERLSIFNRMNPDLTGEPLFLINGIPTRDHAFVLDLNVKNIDIIEILYTKKALLPFGWVGRGGIMAVYTHQPVPVPGIQTFIVSGIHQVDDTHEYDYQEREITSPVPDFDSNIFWRADWPEQKGNQSIFDFDFYTIDETGPLEIMIFGVGGDGSKYFGKKTVNVDLKMTN